VEAQDFTSENAEVLAAVDLIRAHTRGRGIWALDRGADRKNLLGPLLDRGARFVIRSIGQRTVIDRHGLLGSVTEVAGRCRLPYHLEDVRVLKYQRLKNLVILLTAVAYFAAAFLGQQMKLRILCEKLLIISQRFFGVPPFRSYALAEGIRRVLAPGAFSQPEPPPASLQLELALAWEG
jgi:hypothetical protein